MRHRYSAFNGRKFAFQGDLDLASAFLDFVLAHGEEALRAAHLMEQDSEQSELLQELLDQGLLEKVRGRFRLTPRAVNAMQRRALMEVFAQLKRGTRDGHETPEPGSVGDRLEGTRPFEFGDPVSDLDLQSTMRNAIQRTGSAISGRPTEGRRRLLPLQLDQRDFTRFETESRASCSIVVLIDRSGSMARFGRFHEAKKCAMSLIALTRQRFPSDTIDLVGFASAAAPIAEDKLPLLMPQPITTTEPVIRLRVPLDRLNEAPPHFTNLHMGLLQANRILRRRGGDNKMIFIITDGQPTAHVKGDYAYLLYPPTEESHYATLKEAFLIAKQDVRICTFALTDDYWDMDWLGFVDELGRLTRGVTFHCTSGDLSNCVMASYLSGRQRRTFVR
jgi:uncharacterized protein with von Willebrand factor type A (vWA) domain